MSDYYNLVTVEDGHRDSAAIVDVLKGIRDGRLRNDLRLLNYYREIPVSYDAAIAFIDDDMVEVKVHQHQAVVMHVEKMTFLKSSHFPHDVAAKVYKANIEKSVALLTRFSYAQVRAERRRFVRVQVTDPIHATFRHHRVKIAGRLVDISIGGLSLESRDNHASLEESAGVLAIALPGGILEVPGRLIKQAPHEDLWHYIFEMETDTRIEAAVSQFIFQKQVEIIRELKDQIV